MDFASIFVIVGIFVSLHDVGHADCPPDFEDIGNQCYKVVKSEANWLNAKRYCQLSGADLAYILESTDQTNINLLTSHHEPRQRYWLAGTDIEARNQWIWMLRNGVSLPFSYLNWNPGEPNNIGEERCVEIRYDWPGTWNNLNCLQKLRFICRKSSSLDSNGVEIMDATVDDVLKVKEEMDL